MLADRLVILLKAPRVGFVKTRLAQTIGAVAATAAYSQLAECVCGSLADWPAVELRHTPDDAGGELRAWQRPGWILWPQGEGDLGVRLVKTFADHFLAGAGKVVIIGADCPDLTPADIAAAISALSAYDVVLGPASDGGYWLIGLRTPQPTLFSGIPWGTGRVLAETEIRAVEAGLTIARLRVLSDVDNEDDWHRWCQDKGRRIIGS